MTVEVYDQGQEASAQCLEGVDVCYTVKADGEQVDCLVSDRQELGECERWRDLMGGRMVEVEHSRQLEAVKPVAAAALLSYTLKCVSFHGYWNTTHGLHGDCSGEEGLRTQSC